MKQLKNEPAKYLKREVEASAWTENDERRDPRARQKFMSVKMTRSKFVTIKRVGRTE